MKEDVGISKPRMYANKVRMGNTAIPIKVKCQQNYKLHKPFPYNPTL